MTTKLHALIEAAQELSPLEQVELISAISQLLHQHYQQPFFKADFWKPKTLEQLLQDQQVRPMTTLEELRVDFWPEQESIDDFIT